LGAGIGFDGCFGCSVSPMVLRLDAAHAGSQAATAPRRVASTASRPPAPLSLATAASAVTLGSVA
jgi:hypothetical protein